MEKVTFEFNNIQSHERTRFELRPGLNFILAEDNNVGKSTIFKALTTMFKMPQVSNEDLQELLRTDTPSGYVAMKLSTTNVVFWMVREGDRIRAFFETHDGGEVIRTATCPASVLSALDIVMGSDNIPINFNDADSVQLIVQDTQRNDEVLAKVLVDLDVEKVRANAAVLDRNVLQDYRVIQAKYTDSTAVLAEMHYNDAVEAFNAEKYLLYAAVRVMDCLDERCAGLLKTEGKPYVNIDDIIVALRILQALNAAITPAAIPAGNFDGVDELYTAYRVYSTLASMSTLAPRRSTIATDDTLQNMERSLKVLDCIRKVSYAADIVKQATTTVDRYTDQLSSVEQALAKVAPVVKCPMKGDVYFGETCLPVGNGPAHRLL